ncbi:MAG: hypothetical protein J3R72DRAFT_161334 [Linnemannia gamsii]|nr:MAG: hypothetical protein J3R72DRAFT_161334 [Linnemannia gamsii]
MTDGRMRLFCVVDGGLQSKAFSVRITPADTVDDLKKLIKAEKKNDFRDVDADNLTLWRVSIPINDEDNDLPVLLKNVPVDDRKKLGPATRLSKVFPEDLPEETVHVIVQRPLPGNATLLSITPNSYIH